jgi:phosphate transport system substrate-binding protein
MEGNFMKSKKVKFAVLAASIAIMAGLFAGCGSSTTSGNNTNSTTGSTDVSGSITASGSTALLPLVDAAQKSFTAKYPNASVSVQAGGSGTGLTQVSQGDVQIGDSDIFASEKLTGDKAAQLTDHEVCAIGFVVVTTKDTGVTNLTKAQIQDIFTGKDTNWSQVGGKNLPINIIHRTSGSGTRVTFTKSVMGGKTEKDSLGMTEDSSGAVVTAMKQTPGSVSYLAMSYMTSDVKQTVSAVTIDGIVGNTANIITSKDPQGSKYPLWSYEHMYTKGTATGVSKALIDYMMSSDFKNEIIKEGYIPMSDFQ